MIRGGGIFVYFSAQAVPAMNDTFKIFGARGSKSNMAAAITIPELAAMIPSREAFTTRYFFNDSQKRIMKNIRKVPGRNIPAAAHSAPNILPK